jgi:hypothetical protein
MDIMNNMTVSTSKLTFSLIAVFALFVSGSAMLNQDAFAINAPEFTCTHINTTATHCTFDKNVNGTLAILDWTIRNTSTITAGDILTNAQGADGTTITITNIQNSTSAGVGQTAPSAKDKSVSSAAGVVGLGFINGTDFVMIHSAIKSDETYFINYTNNAASQADAINQFGQIYSEVAASSGAALELGAPKAETANAKYLKIGSNATAADWMVPTATSAEIIKSNPKQIRVLMSEGINNLNSTVTDFTINTTGGQTYAPGISSIVAGNGTNYLYINLKTTATPADVLSITYNSDTDNDAHGIDKWITDAIDTTKYQTDGATDTAVHLATGHGNRLANFTTLSVTNWLEIGMFGDVTTCYDCTPPTVTDVKIALDSGTPIKVTDDNKVNINAGIGDTVSVMVTVTDNLGADTIPFAGLYTNFGNTPDNLYYANNFDSAKQMSTSYYEWNVRGDHIEFDNNGAITWTDATAKVNSDRTQTFTYTMTINDAMESSQVWVDIGDKVGNYAKLALPITLEVSGAPGLTFASDDTQKVVSFFNESILLAIVSQWSATSSDDVSNVEQLSSVLGIENQLPTWTTDLASWVADDKIDVADMIVAVEYVINQ